MRYGLLGTLAKNRQFYIEKEVGIDAELGMQIAAHPDNQKYKTVRNFLGIQVNSMDPGGMAMLRQAVIDAKKLNHDA